MSQESSLTQSGHSVRRALTAYSRRILNVATDLTAKPTAPGYDAEALDDLKRALGKLIDRRKGYDQIVLLHFSPVVAYDLADH
jgi:hypothetical protein